MEKRYELEYGMPSTHAMIGLAFPTAFLYFTIQRYEVRKGRGANFQHICLHCDVYTNKFDVTCAELICGANLRPLPIPHLKWLCINMCEEAARMFNHRPTILHCKKWLFPRASLDLVSLTGLWAKSSSLVRLSIFCYLYNTLRHANYSAWTYGMVLINDAKSDTV